MSKVIHFKGEDGWNERVGKIYEELTPKEVKVINYLQNKYDFSKKISAKHLGRVCNVGRATVQRLCKKLGYDGFRPFMESLRDDYFKGITSSDAAKAALSKKHQSALDIFYQGYKVDLLSHEEVYRKLNKKDILACIEAVSEANQIYIIGLQTGCFPAKFLGEKLARLKKKVHIAISGRLSTLDMIFSISEADLLLIFEYSTPSLFISEVIDFAKRRNAKVVTIANYPFSPAIKKSDIALIVQRGVPGFMNSMAIPMSVANSILVAVEFLMEKRGVAIKSLKELDDLKKRIYPDYY